MTVGELKKLLDGLDEGLKLNIVAETPQWTSMTVVPKTQFTKIEQGVFVGNMFIPSDNKKFDLSREKTVKGVCIYFRDQAW
jgi:hypothetical protein